MGYELKDGGEPTGKIEIDGQSWTVYKCTAVPVPAFRYFVRWAGESDWEEVTKENYIAVAICDFEGCAWAVVTGRE